MGNSGSRNVHNVPEQYTRPSGLYASQNGHTLSNAELRRLRRSILDGRMSPCYPGVDEGSAELEECPICFLHYPCLNRSKCCQASICTECFLEIKQQQQQALAQQHQNTNAVVNSNNLNQCCPFCKKTGYAVYFTGRKSKEERAKELAEEQRVIEAQIRARQEEDRIACENAERRRNSRNASASEDGASGNTGRSVERTGGDGERSRNDNQRQAVDEPPYRNEELVRMEEQQRRFEEEQLQRYSSARRQRWVQQQRLFQQQLEHQYRQATIQQQQRGLLAQQLNAAGVRDEMAGVGGRRGGRGAGRGVSATHPDTARSALSTSRGGHGAVRRDPEIDHRRDTRGHGVDDDVDAARHASSADEPVAVANVRDFIPDHLLSESASTATAEMFGVEPGMSIDLEDIMLLEAIWQSLHDNNNSTNDASTDDRNDGTAATGETTNEDAVGDATNNDDNDDNERGGVDAGQDEAMMTASHVDRERGNDDGDYVGNIGEDVERTPTDVAGGTNDGGNGDGTTEEDEEEESFAASATAESPPDAGLAGDPYVTESVQNLESDIEQMLAGIVDTSAETTAAAAVVVVAQDPTRDEASEAPSQSQCLEDGVPEDRASCGDEEESDVAVALAQSIMNAVIERATLDNNTDEQQAETIEGAEEEEHVV